MSILPQKADERRTQCPLRARSGQFLLSRSLDKHTCYQRNGFVDKSTQKQYRSRSRSMTRANIEAFIILQYSNGVGHLVRCSAIAKALSSISHVTLFSGGSPIEGYSAPSTVDFVQLPALRWDFVTGASPEPDRSGMSMARTEQMRSELLVERYLRTRPQIVITEWFPFAPQIWWKH
jgi:hypothetical protein